MRDQGVHSFGEELRWAQLDGLRVSETLMPPGLHLDPHAHEPGQICFVLEGEYRERDAAGASHVLAPGMLQFHAPGELHANAFTSEALTLLVSIDRSRWLRLPAPHPLRAHAPLAALAAEIRHELRRADEASHAALEGLALLLLARVSRLSDGEPPWLADALSWISHHYAAAIGLTDVAAAVGIHRAPLAAAFRRYRATSVGETIRAVRVERAMDALTTTNAPLDEIAFLTGFHDQAHFGRVFRKVTGTTPGAWRRGRG